MTDRHADTVFWTAIAFAFAALFFVLCTGCGADLQGAAKSAADRWAAACGVRPAPGGVTVLDLDTVECGDVAGAAGCTHRHGAAYDVTVAGRSTVPLESLLLHEFGHVLGGHHHTGHGIMVQGITTDRWGRCLTDDDLDAVPECTRHRPECSFQP